MLKKITINFELEPDDLAALNTMEQKELSDEQLAKVLNDILTYELDRLCELHQSGELNKTFGSR